MTVALIIVIFLPAFAAFGVLAMRGSTASLRGARMSNGIAAAGAIALSIATLSGTTVHATLRFGDFLVLGTEVDRLSAVLLPFVLGVGFVVQMFAARYLRGDSAQPWFLASASFLATATAAMVTASTLVGFAAAWTIASGAVWMLLSVYAPLPAARLGARRTLIAFAIGDAALWVAVTIVIVTHGNIALAELTSVQLPVGLSALVAALLLVAAMARSAQLPFHQWLPATLAAPTPVSALLHAGVVNAGGILLVRTSPLFTASEAIMVTAVAVGAVTAIYGTVLMLIKPDVKGALTHSTMGQMGFMIMTCGLGAFGVAIFHLVAHGMYKAALFAGSGSAVHARSSHQSAPSAPEHGRSRRSLHVILAWGGSLTVFLVATPALYPGATAASSALLVFGWFSAAIAVGAMLRASDATLGVVLAMMAGTAAIIGYLTILSGFGTLVAPSIAASESTAGSTWFVGAFVLALLAAEAIRRAPTDGPLGRAHRELYTFALGAGHVPTLAQSRRRKIVNRSVGRRVLRPTATRRPARQTLTLGSELLP